MFASSIEPDLSPGDIFPTGWDADRADSIGPICIFSHGCDIDKSETVLVADIVLASETAGGLLGDMKRGRVWHAFYLEGSAEAGWVNLRTLRQVPKVQLFQNLNRRSHSMNDEGRALLNAKVFSFLSRTLPPAAPPGASPSP
jgi:hypothetical protein